MRDYQKYVLVAVALLFVFIAGAGDGAQTAKKDLGTNTPMYQSYVAQGDTMRMAWYRGDGGNHRWNPSLPSVPSIGFWSGDYWHTMKFVWIYGYACAIATLACAFWTGRKQRLLVWIVVFILAQGIEGNTFRVFYGNFCRNEPKSSIIDILSDINPLKNTH